MTLSGPQGDSVQGGQARPIRVGHSRKLQAKST